MTATISDTPSAASTPDGADPAAIARRVRGAPLVVMLDVDGTLCDITPTPDEAAVPQETRDILDALVHEPNVYVAILTGRSLSDANRLAPVPGIHVYANHGVELVRADGTKDVDRAADEASLAVRSAAATLTRVVATTAGALLEDKGYTLSVHYRNTPPEDVARLCDTVRDVGARTGLEVTTGHHVIELRPPGARHKGGAVQHLLDDLGHDLSNAALFFAGDDLSDEDAFRVLRDMPNATTVAVGGRVPTSAAQFRLPNPAATRALLRTLLEQARAGAYLPAKAIQSDDLHEIGYRQ